VTSPNLTCPTSKTFASTPSRRTGCGALVTCRWTKVGAATQLSAIWNLDLIFYFRYRHTLYGRERPLPASPAAVSLKFVPPRDFDARMRLRAPCPSAVVVHRVPARWRSSAVVVPAVLTPGQVTGRSLSLASARPWSVSVRPRRQAVVFAIALGTVVVWALSGPYFNYSDVPHGFSYSELAESGPAVIQVKLDELIRVSKANNSFMGLVARFNQFERI
jgi:hypothetical protein